jgi:LemA protein
VLLAAMAQLGPEVRLWVASNGPDTERLREQTKADTRIEWLGRLSDEEKIARLKGADVFCAPSLHGESFGVVLIEAMAAGTCVVASALDGYRNVATDGVDSLLVPPGDADALAGCHRSRAARAAAGRAAGGCGQPPCRRLLDAGAGAALCRDVPRGGRAAQPCAPADVAVAVHVAAGDHRAGVAPRGSPHPYDGAVAAQPSQRPRPSESTTMVWIILLVVVVLLVLYAIASYNGLIRGRNQVENAWSQIDVQLKRRIDLIPNLVETVKAYAAHEKSTLEAVINARNAAISAPATPNAGQAAADGQMTGALRQLFALGEAYPDLKANQNFLALQEELSATEGRVAYARQFYNDSVLGYNNKLQAFPTVFFARMLKFDKREYFETDEAAREVPKVQF